MKPNLSQRINIPKFLVLTIAFIAVMAVIWDISIRNHLYHCTDDTGLDFFNPGFWIHGEYISKNTITISESMSEPDSIKQGWSTSKLLGLWISMVSLSLFISLIIARKSKS